MLVTLTAISLVTYMVAASLPTEQSARNVFGRCILPLGMEEGRIPDDAITASSSYEAKSVGPQNARIRQEKNGGAWCPKAQISSDVREYLEIDLTKDHLIAWTETQGRFGNGQGQEYAETFFLEYWRDQKWHQYQTLKGDRVLRGNSNTYLVEKQKLDLPFVASRVRFVPYSQHPRTVCMRVEIYGCVWDQHVARYSAPKGETNGPGGCDVQDSSYDGSERQGYLVDGLGQLTDGILGEESEIRDSAWSGTNWVGWSDRELVQLVFEFRNVREFYNCSVRVARLSDMRIEAFSSLLVWFSIDGANYESNPEKLETGLSDEPNGEPNGEPNVGGVGPLFVPLRSRVGRFVKLEFLPSSKWLLVSEITFESVTSALEPRDDEERGERPTIASTSDPLASESFVSERSLRAYRDRSEARPPTTTSEGTVMLASNDTIRDDKVNDDDSTPDAFPVGTSQTYVGLVSGLLTMLALILTCTAFILKQRGRNKVALLQKHTALICGSSAPSMAINPKNVKLPTPIVVNGLSIDSRKVVATAVETASHANAAATDSRASAGGQRERDCERDCERFTAYERTYKLYSNERSDGRDEGRPAFRKADGTLDFATNSKSNSSLVTEDAGNVLESTTPTVCPSTKIARLKSEKANRKVHEGYYAATDILTIKRRGGGGGEQSSVASLFTPLRIREKDVRLPLSLESYDIQRVSRHRLKILDKLGEGSFGLVHLCEAKGIPSPESGTVKTRQIVIVRSLWRGVVDSLRIDFAKDMYVLAALRDPNIARIIALVEEEPFGAVFEYGQLGDLAGFLESWENSTGRVNEEGHGYEYRFNFLVQIASGMKYLELANIPHCDLAARNCIVGQGLTIKVSDHAIYCGKYDHHYYVDGSYAKIPLRWMAWEAVLLGKRSCRGDVWSFAVTAWEILTSCKELPYCELTAEQVLENCSRWYRGNDGHVIANKTQPRLLSHPSSCPESLYRLMTRCWSKQIEERPTFEEIYLSLERLGLD